MEIAEDIKIVFNIVLCPLNIINIENGVTAFFILLRYAAVTWSFTTQQLLTSFFFQVSFIFLNYLNTNIVLSTVQSISSNSSSMFWKSGKVIRFALFQAIERTQNSQLLTVPEALETEL